MSVCVPPEVQANAIGCWHHSLTTNFSYWQKWFVTWRLKTA